MSKGYQLSLEPEDVDAFVCTYFDCWSPSGDENSRMFDLNGHEACALLHRLLADWSEILGLPDIHPDVLLSHGTFLDTFVSHGIDKILDLVFAKVIVAGYSVYSSDTRIEIYHTDQLSQFDIEEALI